MCELGMWVVNSKAFSANSDLFALSITVDNALFIPLFYYLLVIRRKLAPSFTIVPVFLISVAIAHTILPPGSRQYLAYIGMIIPLVELCLLTFLIIKARKLVREYREVASWEEKREGTLKASLVVAPNIALHLRTPVTVRGILRSKENIERIGIYLDDAQLFTSEMQTL